MEEIKQSFESIPKMFKSKFLKMFDGFDLEDFENVIDFNHKCIEIFTTPFYLPSEYKHKLVKPFRTITQEFVDSLKTVDECRDENKKTVCSNLDLKSFLSENIGKKYVVEEVDPKFNHTEMELTFNDKKELLKNVITAYCKKEYEKLFIKYDSLEFEDMFFEFFVINF